MWLGGILDIHIPIGDVIIIVTELAGKILFDMVKSFDGTEEEISYGSDLADEYPNEKKHIIRAAIDMLVFDGLLNVFYKDNEPNIMVLNICAVRDCDEFAMLKRGYLLAKEIHSLI